MVSSKQCRVLVGQPIMAEHLNQFYKPQLELITTPNKNIQSSFMRNEQSYIVRESERFPSYRKDEDFYVVILTAKDLIIGKDFSDCKILTSNALKYTKKGDNSALSSISTPASQTTKNGNTVFSKNSGQQNFVSQKEIENSTMNERKTDDPKKQLNTPDEVTNTSSSTNQPLNGTNITVASDNDDQKHLNTIATKKVELPDIFSEQVHENKPFFDESFCFGNFCTKKFENIEFLKTHLFNEISSLQKIPKNSFVTFVFSDTFVRSEIIACIDLFLKHFKCKGICLLPYSLALSLGLCLNFSSVVSQYNEFRTYSFIEDFCFILNKTSYLESSFNDEIFVVKKPLRNNILKFVQDKKTDDLLTKNNTQTTQLTDTPLQTSDVKDNDNSDHHSKQTISQNDSTSLVKSQSQNFKETRNTDNNLQQTINQNDSTSLVKSQSQNFKETRNTDHNLQRTINENNSTSLVKSQSQNFIETRNTDHNSQQTINENNSTSLVKSQSENSEKGFQKKNEKSQRNVFSLFDDHDFVEDFHKPSFKYGFCACVCSICERSFEKENILQHIKESHSMKNEDDTKLHKLYKEVNEIKYHIKDNTVHQELKSCLSNNFTPDRIKKLSANIVLDQDLVLDDPTTIIENIGAKIHIASPLDAFKGASMFSQLDCARDCWMTDKEWKASRIRILKEKTLFYI